MGVKELKLSVRQLLEENILRYWLDKMTDYENGGYYGQRDGNDELHPTADKGAILNARILWTFSAAYRVLGKKEYLTAATRAKDYIIRYFLDPEYGGVYWSVNYKGEPVDTKKQFYAIGFVIYGMSEYARATGDEEALRIALELFDIIEEHAWDAEFGGYIEAMTCDWQPIADMRLSEKNENYPKSQNTHLHIIEPYTNLYRTISSLNIANSQLSTLNHQLKRLISIFTDKILNPETDHLDLFFGMDWKRMGRQESYGHDIECSWLLHEVALVLGDKEILAKVEPIVRKVAKASGKGLNPDGSMCYEANLETGHFDTDRHWWVQAENVVGWLNIYQHFGDKDAWQKAINCYQYILNFLIDREHGEWYWSCDANGIPNRHADKAGFWKCPYHNGRMCLEIIERTFPTD